MPDYYKKWRFIHYYVTHSISKSTEFSPNPVKTAQTTNYINNVDRVSEALYKAWQ